MADAVFPSPTAAYRADVQGRGTSLGPHDDRWLAAASALHFAAGTTGTEREEHLSAAISAGLDLVGSERIDAFTRREWLGERSFFDPVVVLADAMYYDGARRLAAVMLDDLRRTLPGLSPVQLGRVLVRRARITWSLGALDEAADRYDFLGRLGKSARNLELRTQSEFGFATLAHFRGDFPELRKRSARARALAEKSGNPALVRVALHATMIGSATAGDFDAAVMDGWGHYLLSVGHPLWEAEALVNLGQLMMEMGHPDTARAAFAAAVALPIPARVLLPALGGLAVSSALAGREATVEWTVREVWRAQDLSVQPYPVAIAHLECAVALHTLGRVADAERHRRAAEEMARRNQFHEIAFRASELEAAPAPRRPAPLAREAEEVTGQLAAMEPERLPSVLAFDVAPV